MLLIEVIGIPAPQGSKKGFYNKKLNRVLLVESSAKVKPWRQAVTYAASGVVGLTEHISGPVKLFVTFSMPRPKCAKPGAYADKRPDISKLLRSTEDALTDAGVWDDDARVIEVHARKLYAGDPEAMKVPGATIKILSA